MNNLFKNIGAGLLALTLISTSANAVDAITSIAFQRIDAASQNLSHDAKIELATSTRKISGFAGLTLLCFGGIGVLHALTRREPSILIAGASFMVMCYGRDLCCVSVLLKKYRDRLLASHP